MVQMIQIRGISLAGGHRRRHCNGIMPVVPMHVTAVRSSSPTYIGLSTSSLPPNNNHIVVVQYRRFLHLFM